MITFLFLSCPGGDWLHVTILTNKRTPLRLVLCSVSARVRSVCFISIPQFPVSIIGYFVFHDNISITQAEFIVVNICGGFLYSAGKLRVKHIYNVYPFVFPFLVCHPCFNAADMLTVHIESVVVGSPFFRVWRVSDKLISCPPVFFSAWFLRGLCFAWVTTRVKLCTYWSLVYLSRDMGIHYLCSTTRRFGWCLFARVFCFFMWLNLVLCRTCSARWKLLATPDVKWNHLYKKSF